jgi:hypothetical protein
MHAIGSICLLINGMLCSYAASRTGIRIVREPAYCSTEDFWAVGLFVICAFVAGWAFAQ